MMLGADESEPPLKERGKIGIEWPKRYTTSSFYVFGVTYFFLCVCVCE
jgi:hypothetical protein